MLRTSIVRKTVKTLCACLSEREKETGVGELVCMCVCVCVSARACMYCMPEVCRECDKSVCRSISERTGELKPVQCMEERLVWYSDLCRVVCRRWECSVCVQVWVLGQLSPVWCRTQSGEF